MSEEPVKKDEEPIKQLEAKPTSEAATVEKIISPEKQRKLSQVAGDEILEAKVGMRLLNTRPVAPGRRTSS